MLTMDNEGAKSNIKAKRLLLIRQVHGILAPQAHSVIIAAALLFNLGCKFYWASRKGLILEYPLWIFSDIAVLLGIEVILSLFCYHWPKKWVIRVVVFFAALVCTWSVMNAGWLIKNGWQILPGVLLSLKRDPLNVLILIGENLKVAPLTAVVLLLPSAILLIFFFSVLVKPQLPNYNRKPFEKKIMISGIIIVLMGLAYGLSVKRNSGRVASEGLRNNCQLNAIVSLFSFGPHRLVKTDFDNAKRHIPNFKQLEISLPAKQHINHNVVIVVLEGIQYKLTSLLNKDENMTPYLLSCAEQGAVFVNARSCLTHTTKALFGLLTGRFPSASQDLAEAVPVSKPYASLATILKQKLNFRTAFFQSAKGNFECRPGLVHNLGFDKFWARDDLNDPNAFLGYLACDEFSMLEPITAWIKADERPFLLTVLCSVSHDPYEVPEWFAEPADEPLERYKQTIFYTDKFLEALDVELTKLNLTENTIFCVVGDHGEAFGEHDLFGHEKNAFDETLRIPFVLRAQSLIEPRTKIYKPISSIDLTPTILALLGFDITKCNFDGIDTLKAEHHDRKVYFSGWIQQTPTGYIQENRKFVYNPVNKVISVYDLSLDPFELVGREFEEQESKAIIDELISWRKNTIYKINQQKKGQITLFKRWLCRWANRVSTAKFQNDLQPSSKNFNPLK